MIHSIKNDLYQYLEDFWVEGYWIFILNNLNKIKNWHTLSANPNITWKIIQNNPDKPWNWNGISCNPNITWYKIIQINHGIGLVYQVIPIKNGVGYSYQNIQI